MALCSTFGWLKSGTQTYIILNAMSDAAFYFLPILLAASCAKKFKCNQGTAMALGGLLVYPGLTTLMTGISANSKAIAAAGSYEAALAAGTIAEGAASSIKLFGIIPIQVVTSYASSVIPIILGVWLMSYVEKFMQKYCPKAVKFFFVPFFSLVIAGIGTLAILGPIGTWASELIQIFFTWLKNTAPWIVPTVVGIFSPLLVMTGTHYGLIPIGTNNLTTAGHDAVVGPGMLVSNTAQGAAGLAVAVRSKNPDTKQLASSAGLTGILGITEPVLYGVNLKYTFPLYAAMIGGGVGGLFLGLMGVERFGAGSPGLLVLPVYLPTAEAAALGYTMVAFMRGRTLNDAVVILDEAQNTTSAQLRMFLTRMGWNAKMIITGDMTQVDLPRGTQSGLREALGILGGVEGISVVNLTQTDIVHHKLVTKIVKAYEKFDKSKKE